MVIAWVDIVILFIAGIVTIAAAAAAVWGMWHTEKSDDHQP